MNSVSSVRPSRGPATGTPCVREPRSNCPGWGKHPLAVLITALMVFSALPALAARIPSPQRPVCDEARVLDSSSAAAVRQVCNTLERDTGAELVILTMRTTSGENHHDFALRTFNSWGIGRAGRDNGMLIFFAMDDRRVEIIPGTRYKSWFDADTCTNLLTTHVTPQMKKGNPREGVIAAARQVADRVRVREKGAAAAPVGRPVKPGIPSGIRPTANPGPLPPPPPSTSPSRSTGSVVMNKRSGQFTPGRILIFGLLAVWLALGIFYFASAFWYGNLLISKWVMYPVLALGAIGLVPLALKELQIDRNLLDGMAGGAWGVGSLVFFFCSSHVCPRCNRYMSVDTRTLRSATYTSSGLGEQTEHCDSCLYHNVFTYTISRKTRHSHRSSSSGSRSSGGRFSGGGGGASW